VINYDLPNVPEDYVHRIGRTARMKAVGSATSFVTPEDSRQIHAIEKLLGQSVPRASGSQPAFRPQYENTTSRQKTTAGHGPRHLERSGGFRPRRPGGGSRPIPSSR
jgi:ATP-dependent RNA helicase RhlE